jgi:hypothetical protein
MKTNLLLAAAVAALSLGAAGAQAAPVLANGISAQSTESGVTTVHHRRHYYGYYYNYYYPYYYYRYYNYCYYRYCY